MSEQASSWRRGPATDGAWAEDDAGDRSSRSGFLTKAVLSVGAAGGGAVLLGSLAAPAASAPSAEQDVRILNFLLQLEHAQERLYAAAQAAGTLKGELATFARVVGGHERQHVAALRSELGADARRRPEVQFGDAVRSQAAFTEAALALEEAAAAGYIGQAANLTRDRISAVARIVAVEARHAAWIRDFAGQLPAPNAADPAQTPDEVMKALERTGFVIRS